MLRRQPISAIFIPLAIVCSLLICPNKASAQTTTFIYHGHLQDGGRDANGNYDFQFTLWDSLSGGTQQPQPTPLTVSRPGVGVSGGVFTVQLDFGINALPGADRFLEIGVRAAGSASFTTLAPRQPITSTPYAIRTLNATAADTLSTVCVSCVQDAQIGSVAGTKVIGTVANAATANSATNATNAATATNATQLGGVAAGQYVQTSDSRLTDARPPTPGSTSYIQNSNQQGGTDFNISGSGTAGGTLAGNQVTGNVVNATVQYNLNGNRAFSVSGVGSLANSNTFVGIGAGTDTTPEIGGAGSLNSFFGVSAGLSNTTGGFNSFFGANAGIGNTTGRFNSFFGTNAGRSNTTGGFNSFFGAGAGLFNAMGDGNSFFGQFAGKNNTTGTNNTVLGYGADVGSDPLTNATAIGAQARVDATNALVLGSINGVNGATADTKVGIGVTSPQATLHVVGPAGAVNSDATPVLQVIGGKGGRHDLAGPGRRGSGVLIQAGDGGDDDDIGGEGGSIVLVPGSGGSAPLPGPPGVVDVRGEVDVKGKAVVRGLGIFANNPGAADLQVGYGLAAVGTAGLVTRLALQPYGRIDGPWKFVTRDDATKAYLDWVYGPAATGITQDSSGNVGIATNAPNFRLHVIDPGSAGLRVQTNSTGGSVASFGGNGDFRIDAPFVPGGRFIVHEDGKVGIGIAGPDATLTVNGTADKPNGGSWATFSDERLKNIKGNFIPGLHALMRLQPLRYEYKQDNALGIQSEGEHIGFSAQQVQRIIPEAVSQNDKGYLLVNNDPILWTMLNAIKEQQAQIEKQQKQIDGLKKVACRSHRTARVCR